MKKIYLRNCVYCNNEFTTEQKNNKFCFGCNNSFNDYEKKEILKKRNLKK